MEAAELAAGSSITEATFDTPLPPAPAQRSELGEESKPVPHMDEQSDLRLRHSAPHVAPAASAAVGAAVAGDCARQPSEPSRRHDAPTSSTVDLSVFCAEVSLEEGGLESSPSSVVRDEERLDSW